MSLTDNHEPVGSSIGFRLHACWGKMSIIMMLMAGVLTNCSLQEQQKIVYPTSEEVKQIADNVFKWQKTHHSKADWGPNWLNATLYHGVITSGIKFRDEQYLDWAKAWANHNNWDIGKQKLHPDAQASGLSYLLLYEAEDTNSPSMITDYIAAADSLITTTTRKDLLWSWSDALYMAPPALIKAAELTGKQEYRQFVHQHFWESHKQLYNNEYNLFFRDINYRGLSAQADNPVFWSRGNGWVVGALVNILNNLPKQDVHYNRYLQLYKDMMRELTQLQAKDGLWRTNLRNVSVFPTPETSGSAFFSYGLAWGINQKILTDYTYHQALEKAWSGLVSNINSEGKLGSSQGVASKPGKVDPENNEIYSTGAFLLTAAELFTLTKKSD